MKKFIFPVVLLCGFVLLSACILLSNKTPAAVSGFAPQESPSPSAFYERGLPPEGWKSGTLWLIAVHNTGKEGSSMLEIDWARFYCMVNGQPVLMSGETPSNRTGVYWSGSWPKIPWCRGTEDRRDMKVDFTGETALLPLHERPERVWHFGGKRVIVPDNASKCYSEARVKVSGNTLVQLGADFWIDDKSEWCPDHKCNAAGFGSDWFGASDKWIKITAGKN